MCENAWMLVLILFLSWLCLPFQILPVLSAHTLFMLLFNPMSYSNPNVLMTW